MDKDPESRSRDAPTADPLPSLKDCAPLVEWLYARAKASRWGLSHGHFAMALERSASKRWASGALSAPKLEEYLGALHLEDLALATACAEGCEAAWEYFFTQYRTYLRAAAAAIIRSGSAEASDLADSLFSELYGLAGGPGSERSLFRYFHGRSSLKTWLRAVLARRHIDAIRAGRRFEELGEDQTGEGRPKMFIGPPIEPRDPYRERYVRSFARALEKAIGSLQPQERERLRLYYAEEKTLAEIGRLLGEHESSVSRHLDHARRDLRQAVESLLRHGIGEANGSAVEPGLSDAEIVLCFEYSAQDAPIDLQKLLPRSNSRAPATAKRTP